MDINNKYIAEVSYAKNEKVIIYEFESIIKGENSNKNKILSKCLTE